MVPDGGLRGEFRGLGAAVIPDHRRGNPRQGGLIEELFQGRQTRAFLQGWHLDAIWKLLMCESLAKHSGAKYPSFLPRRNDGMVKQLIYGSVRVTGSLRDWQEWSRPRMA